MTTKTVKVPEPTHATLVELARERRQPMGDVVADLVYQEHKRAFLEGLNDDFARLRADPAAWAEYQEEVLEMEGVLMDGLEDDPWQE